MRRKLEENLIRLAFGDIDPKDAGRAEKLLADDVEASKLFAGYEEIREGLKQLQTPEHQLSADRLREAILRDGLKKDKPAASGWRWALAPVAVAAAAMFLTMRFGPRPSSAFPAPSVENAAHEFSLGKGPDLSPSTTSKPIEFSPRDVVTEPGEAGVRSPVRAPARKRESVVARTPAATAIGGRAASAEARPAVSPEAMSHLAIEGALPAGAVALNFDSGEDQSIVLIGTDSDESTGANRATEVSSANNVIVGG